MKLIDISNTLKFNWKNTYAATGGDAWLNHEFEIEPDEFLLFAEKDYSIGGLQGLVNSVTNAKRAIDCQIDKIISCFGYDPHSALPDTANLYIDEYQKKVGAIEATQKLKLLQSLDVVPSSLVASMREVRNKLEHYYKAPKKSDALHIIDLAKLFIRSSDYVLKLFPDEWMLLDTESPDQSTKIISIEYPYQTKKFSVKLKNMVPEDGYEFQGGIKSCCIGEIEVSPTDNHYLHLIALNVCAAVDGYIRDPLFDLVSSVDPRIRKSQFSFKGYTDEPS